MILRNSTLLVYIIIAIFIYKKGLKIKILALPMLSYFLRAPPP